MVIAIIVSVIWVVCMVVVLPLARQSAKSGLALGIPKYRTTAMAIFLVLAAPLTLFEQYLHRLGVKVDPQ